MENPMASFVATSSSSVTNNNGQVVSSSVLVDMVNITVDMGRDLAGRVRIVLGYIQNDSLATNLIKYKNFVVKTLVEQPEKETIGIQEVLLAILSIVFFLFSIGTDIALASYFFKYNQYWWGSATLMALLIPLILVNVLSLAWYRQNEHTCSVEPIILKKQSRFGTPTAWIVCVLMHIVLLGQVYRTAVMLYYGMKAWQTDHSSSEVSSRKSSTSPSVIIIDDNWELRAVEETTVGGQNTQIESGEIDFYAAYIHQDKDMTNLDIIDGFLHDGSQVILQVYILTTCQRYSDEHITTPLPVHSSSDENDHGNTQHMMSFLSSILSLIILSWSYAKLVRANRLHDSEKKKISRLGMIGQFIWHIYTLIPRVVSMSLLASSYTSWIMICAGFGHWMLMTLWVRWERSRPNKNHPNGYAFSLWEFSVDLTIGYIQIFSYFNVRDGPSRLKYFLFYLLVLAENTIFLVLWYIDVNQNGSCHEGVVKMSLSTVMILTSMYLIGIFYLVLYYKCCHPNGRRKRGSFSPRSSCDDFDVKQQSPGEE